MANLDQIMDYVADNIIIETGEQNHWKYRKWADGTAECWYKYAFSGVNTAGALSGWQYATISTLPAFPTGLFSEEPAVMIGDMKWGTGFCYSAVREVTSSQITKVDVFSTNIGDKSGQLSFHAIGKWQ